MPASRLLSKFAKLPLRPSRFRPTLCHPSLPNAVNFASSSFRETVLSFCNAQMSRASTPSLASLPTDRDWNSLAHLPIRPEAGKVRTSTLLRQRNIGGSIWLQQFLFGFPLVGAPIQPHDSPTSSRQAHTAPLDPAHLHLSSCARFTERVKRPGFKNCSDLRAESYDPQRKGWRHDASPLTAEGGHSNTHTLYLSLSLSDRSLNVEFRVGAEQAAKLRACDIIRHSMTNLACAALTPIKISAWGHLSEMCKMTKRASFDWHLFKSDRELAYKQLPLNLVHSSIAVSALRSPPPPTVDGADL